MDPRCVDSDAKQAMPSAKGHIKTKQLAEAGIFSNGDLFSCLVCDRTIEHMGIISAHMRANGHLANLKKASDSCTKVNGNFVCKLCENYPASDWKTFLYHFDAKHHFEALSNEEINTSKKSSEDADSCFYIRLVRNQIIEPEPGTFFCCCCKMMVGGQGSILQHITGDNHQELKKILYTKKYTGVYSEAEAIQVVQNFIHHAEITTFFCYLCKMSINGKRRCNAHVRTNEHVENLILRGHTNSQSLPTNLKENKSPQTPPPRLSQNETSALGKLMRDNSITGPSRRNNYYCKLCVSRFAGSKNAMAHVLSVGHKSSMKASGKELKSSTESEETSDGSSSSWVSTENSSESWETYEGESQSYDDSRKNSSSSWETTDNISDSWETISIQGSSSEHRKSTPFEIPTNYLPLISKHFLIYRENEIFCPLCEAHLRSLQSLIDHTRSKYHVAELNRHKDKIAKKNKKDSATSGKSSAASSSMNATNKKKPSQPATKYETGNVAQNNVAQKAGGLQSTLFKIPENLVPLISKHMLQDRKTEIFCVACEARLQTPTSLIQHTKSKQHVIKLERYKAQIARQDKKLADTSGRNSTSSSVSSTISKKKFPESINTQHFVRTDIQKAVAKESQSLQSNLFKLPSHLIPVLAPHSLQRLEQEVFCLACQVHLRHVSNMIQHIASQNHVATLKKYKAGISKKDDVSGKISKANTAVNSPINKVNEKPSSITSQSDATTQKSGSSNPQNPQSNLMEIPKKLLPLITIHSLKHLKNEIYCVACQTHIKNASGLVSHTSSPRHAARLQSFRASTSGKKNNAATQSSQGKNLQPSMVEVCKELELIKETLVSKIEPHLRGITSGSENKTGLENALHKLTIAEANGENSKKLPLNQTTNLKNRPPRQMKPRKLDNRPIKSRVFDPKYLKVDMQHIYKVYPEKLRLMKLSCQLCFPKTSSTVYCLICEKSVPSKLQNFYEHICGSAHTVYLAEAEQHHKHFIDYPDQFSDLTLAKEYMQEHEVETVQCFACDVSIRNDDIVILEHIAEDSHKERKQLWNERTEKILQEILAEMKSTWYNIQKYWCQPCDTEYNTEFHFAEHMESKKHKNCLKKMGEFRNRLVYDSCIACATLWIGFAGVYPQHCEQPMHKYLVQSGDFSICKLPSQAMLLLTNADAEVASLIELSDQVLTVQKVKADSLLKCLEDTVKPLYPNAKAHPLGSRVSGLGFPDSDIDVFLDCGTYDGNRYNKEFQEQLIICVERCLYNNQESWEIEETLVTTRTPIIKIRHRDTELRCDVSFKNGLSVENTKLLKCFIDNYPLCRKMMLFLKKWLSICNLSGSQYITNYANCWYVIFYLQRRSILPSIASMIAKGNKSKIIDGWETGISETLDIGEQEFTFTELLHGFFVFYSDFDYRDSVACPLIGKTILKQDFTDLDLLPKEMAPYINHVTTKSVDGHVELFRIDSEMCIQDPYDLSHNLTKAVRKLTLNRFKRLCAKSAEILSNFIQH